MEFTAFDVMRNIELRRARNEAFEQMLAGSIKPYRALSTIYADISKYDPYIVDWLRVFTPIEYDAWDTIREYCLPFYPQYPVHGVILDFADPVKKIAIECDGKNWHDAEKDSARDVRLASYGWKTYRIPGSECRRVIDGAYELSEKLRDEEITQEEYEAGMDAWAFNSSEGVISSIATVFYGFDLKKLDHDRAMRSLKMHKGAQ